MDIVEINDFQLTDETVNEIEVLEPEEGRQILEDELLRFSSSTLNLVFSCSFLW